MATVLRSADAAPLVPPALLDTGGRLVFFPVRHHSPACARLVAQRIHALRPAHVLIEGPADFNARLDELHLPHRLPVAIYSYLCGDDMHRGSWSPLAEHSPEWQALQAALGFWK